MTRRRRSRQHGTLNASRPTTCTSHCTLTLSSRPYPAPAHRKHAIERTDMLDFLKEIVADVPDPSAGGTIDVEGERAEGELLEVVRGERDERAVVEAGDREAGGEDVGVEGVVPDAPCAREVV